MRNLICFLAAVLLSFAARSQSTLVAGDIAFVAYISTGSPDTFAFVVLKPEGFQSGTSLCFTDNSWFTSQQGGPAFRTGEGIIRWTATSTIGYGELVQVWVGTSSGIGSNKGSCANLFGSVSLSTSGDQLFAFQGGNWPEPGTMIAGLHFNRTASTSDANWDPGSITKSANASSFPNAAMEASGNKLLPNTCGVWIRDISVGASVKAKSAYWKGITDASLFSNDPEVLRARINTNAGWTGYYSGSGAPPWKMPSTLAVAQLSIRSTIHELKCAGDHSGSIELQVSGGTQPYQFVWGDGAVSDTRSGLAAGNYSCTINDASHNSASVLVTVPEPAVLELDVLLQTGTCPGSSDGSIEVIGSGGTGLLNYSWSNGLFGNKLEGLSSGNTSVELSDENHCRLSMDIEIEEFEAPQPVLPNFGPLCPYSSILLNMASPAGGVYFGDHVNDSLFEPEGPGNYLLGYSLTDQNGCEGRVEAMISVLSSSSAIMQSMQDVCSNTEPFVLNSGIPAGGHYKGPGVVNDHFYPELAGLGTHQLVYTIGDAHSDCPSVAVGTINVNSIPLVDFPQPAPVCLNIGPVELMAHPAAGILSGPGISGRWFDPKLAGMGEHILHFTYTRAQTGCTATQERVIQVKESVPLIAKQFPLICEGSGNVGLDLFRPTGGTYTCDHCSAGDFDPSDLKAGNYTINYSFSDGSGCQNSIDTILTVHAAPPLSFEFGEKICQNGAPIMLRGGLPVGGSYQINNLENDSLDPEQLPPGISVLSYTYTDQLGCSSIMERNIELLAVPELTASPIPTFCSNQDPVQLSLVAPVGGNYSGTATNGIEFAPVRAGAGVHIIRYSLPIENGCIAFLDLNIEVHETIKPAVVMTETSFCAGAGINLICETEGNHQWFNNGSPIPDAQDSILWIDKPGNFSVELQNGFCSMRSDAVDINITELPKPVIEVSGGLCAGNSFTLRIAQEGDCQWFFNGVPLPGADTKSVEVSQLGKYSVQLTDERGCFAMSEEIELIAEDKAPLFSDNGFILCSGSSLSLRTTTASEYRWFRNGLELNAEVSHQLKVDQPGIYKVKLRTADGCERESAEVLISLAPAPLPQIRLSGGERFCYGGKSKLTVIGDFEQYQWVRNAVSIPGALYSSMINETSGELAVVVMDSNGCSGSSEPVQFYVDPLPNVDVGSSFRLACGAEELKIGSVPGDSVVYSWFRNGEIMTNEFSSSIIIGANGVYQLKALSSKGCVAESRMVLVQFLQQPEAPWLVESSPGILRSSAMLDNRWFCENVELLGDSMQELTITKNGSYSVRVGKQGCYSWSEPFDVMNLSEGERADQSWGLQVFPNPAYTEFKMIAPETGVLRVYNAVGAFVKQMKVEKGLCTIEVGQLVPGIYQLILEGKDVEYHSRLFIE